jgi:hypothetical protein
MKIVVLVKQVPDTYEERRLDPATGILDRAASEAIIDEIGEYPRIQSDAFDLKLRGSKPPSQPIGVN